jgi:hypothetical protein
LVKWLLVIPHYVVLAFLWLGFVVASVGAFFAILVTGRYPRALFDYNVGVMRWTWRVTYYAYGGLGTDRYPPFTLDDVPGYPAHFSVDYPEHLSRGLVLVKWWLLALPHYLIVGLFVGGGAWVSGRSDGDGNWSWGAGGLVTLLVCVAAIVLLVRGSYPRPIFDIVLGMQRWALRVAGYAALMTDVYPPFRLDLGGDDPDALALEPPPAPGGPGTAQPGPGARGTWGTGRVVALVAGSLLALTAMVPLIGGGALTIADRAGRDDDGYLTSPTVTVTSDGYAVTSDRLLFEAGGPAWAVPSAALGTTRVRVTAVDPSHPVFVGVGRTADVDRYLAGVGYSTSREFRNGSGVDYAEHAGGAPATSPADQTFWTQQAAGAGRQTLSWEPTAGDWTLVVMNADAGRPVAAVVDAAATAPAITWIGVGLLVVGIVGLVLGTGVIVAAVAATGSSAPAGRGPGAVV